MFLGNRRKIFIVFVLILLSSPFFGQKIQEDTKGKYYLKADTTYSDTVIGGRSVVIRNITIYDTVYLVAQNEPHGLVFETLDFSPSFLINEVPNVPVPGIRNWDFEAGVSYGIGIPFQPLVGYDQALNSVQNTNYFDGFLHAAKYYNNWYVKSGLNMSFAREKISYSKDFSVIDSSDFYTFSYDSMVIDTSIWLDIEALPDTAYIMIIDTAPYLFTDTLFRNKTKTIKSEPISRYFRIGVPVLVGHIFEYKKFDLAIESGLYFNMLVNVNGKTINYNNNLVQLKNKYLYRFSTDFAIRVQFRYKLKSMRYVTLTPVVRYNLLDLYRSPDLVRWKNLSFRFAIGYNFY